MNESEKPDLQMNENTEELLKLTNKISAELGPLFHGVVLKMGSAVQALLDESDEDNEELLSGALYTTMLHLLCNEIGFLLNAYSQKAWEPLLEYLTEQIIDLAKHIAESKEENNE